MPRLKLSVAYRIAFTYSVVTALAILALAVAVYFGASAEFGRQQDAGIADESAALVREFREGGLPDIRKAITKRESFGVHTYGYALFDVQGAHVAGALATSRPEAGVQDIVFADAHEKADPARALATDLPGGYRLVVARDIANIRLLDRTILGLFGLALAAVLATGAVGGLILGHYLRHRLRGISVAAAAIMAGDMSQRLPLANGNDEFDQAGRALNLMLDRINQLLENLRQVSSDVAHDLRTPLLRLRQQLEQVGSVDGAAQKAMELGDGILALFAAILRIAEIESGSTVGNFGSVDISALATDLAETYTPAFSDRDRNLSASIQSDLVVAGDRVLLAQAVINLLDNAGLHTPTGTNVVLTCEADECEVCLTVADNGPGVPIADHDKIFRRFFRGEASRTSSGNGLGLSLVAAVAGVHRGRVAVKDVNPGLGVCIHLPRLV